MHQGAIDVLGPVVDPGTVHQSKFSMGTVLALAARHGHAGLDEFDNEYLAATTVALREKVGMVLDPEVDAAYPQRWIGKVTVLTTDGRTLHGRVEEPKGDPGNTLSARGDHGQGAAPDRLWRCPAGRPRTGRRSAAVADRALAARAAPA